MNSRRCLIFIYGSLFLTAANGNIADSLEYRLMAGGVTGGGEHAPLWITSKRDGLLNINRNQLFLTAGIFLPVTHKGAWSYDGGVELFTSGNGTGPFLIRQAYADVRYKNLELSVGSKIRPDEFRNVALSSGGLSFSGNALPIPEVRLGLADYWNIPGLRNWLGVKGYLSYGIFTDGNWQETFTGGKSQYVKHALFHSKALYLRVGNERVFPLTLDLGLDMPARFSGTYYRPGKEPIKIPHRLKDFWNMLVPVKGDAQTLSIDHENILGDVLGRWNFTLNYRENDWYAKVYLEHQFNDHSQLFWQYGWKDGLYGVEVGLPSNNFLSSVVYEYLYSKDQTGPVYHDSDKKVPDQISGDDDYYNHGVYSGWQHWGMALGNPLFVSPIYNANGSLFFRSNRIIAHHIGLSGNPTRGLSYRLLCSYTRHWGTYNNPLDEILYNWNFLGEVVYSPHRLRGWTFTMSLAGDRSDYIGNSIGGMLTVAYRGRLLGR